MVFWAAELEMPLLGGRVWKSWYMGGGLEVGVELGEERGWGTFQKCPGLLRGGRKGSSTGHRHPSLPPPLHPPSRPEWSSQSVQPGAEEGPEGPAHQLRPWCPHLSYSAMFS